MSEAKKCDRCNEFEEAVSPSINDLKVSPAVSMGTRPRIPGKVHLCNDCQESFTEWFQIQ